MRNTRNENQVPFEPPPDELTDALSTPTLFRPEFVQFGGAKIALLLSKALFCQRWAPTSNGVVRGWFYETQKDWQKSTGLTRREMESARKKLKKLGFLRWKLAGNPAKTYYHVEIVRIREAMDKSSETAISSNDANSESRLAENAKLGSANQPSKIGGISQTLLRVPSKNTSYNGNKGSFAYQRPTESELYEYADKEDIKKTVAEAFWYEHVRNGWCTGRGDKKERIKWWKPTLKAYAEHCEDSIDGQPIEDTDELPV